MSEYLGLSSGVVGKEASFTVKLHDKYGNSYSNTDMPALHAKISLKKVTLVPIFICNPNTLTVFIRDMLLHRTLHMP